MALHSLDGGADQVARLGGGGGLVEVHPGIVFADVHHLELVGVEAALLGGSAKGLLVKVRGTGGDHDAVEAVLADVVDNELLAGVRAHVLVVARQDDPRQRGGPVGNAGYVDDAGDICAAVADVDADTHFGFRRQLWHGSGFPPLPIA